MPPVHAYHDPFQADLLSTTAKPPTAMSSVLFSGGLPGKSNIDYLQGGFGTPAPRGILRPPFVIFPKPCLLSPGVNTTSIVHDMIAGSLWKPKQLPRANLNLPKTLLLCRYCLVVPLSGIFIYTFDAPQADIERDVTRPSQLPPESKISRRPSEGEGDAAISEHCTSQHPYFL
ncbi:hypothetical protein H112_02342 [Trichophyton rubrum D6]|uniref:Uncharacterized protein n=3 Tax=Trichophyton TaxID=5550 RepID=A0A178F5N7_TRIRU|nr:hypothetical protein H100_02343 [Trichophyton rubrum MR850]EZF44354.1 hypothetical protein H102_02341 [Trichophyton rubrum CBS 100081]EZF55049.1 hypothetical protein H103_02351 [Trichophyton rubrum CBS 288.86]EZF65630.1 hypothetical protein H104_02327 [Trichophyton rubrum CBS 289.86]EZF76211.1 hypothetical protein H105_02361 [Trichophyton soudanense CBS 452.61]EZF86922.1 hypothetical protein H110_02347 [Trichophyton rubrum MR1448]EZF97709.1 hypothetical protein H113_02354 [Trichophyton rub